MSTSRFRAALGLCLLTGCSQPVEKLWQYKSSSSSSTPAVSGDLIVFGLSSGELHAVTRGGAFLWKKETRKEVVAAPQIAGNLIYVGSTNNNLYALDKAGREVWKFTTLGRLKGDPLVQEGVVYFGSYDKHVYALDALTHEEKWIYPPERLPQPGEAIADANLPEEGAPPPDTSQWPTDAFSYARPTLTSDGLVVVGNLDGYLYAFKAATGELAWRFATEGAAQKKGVTSTVVERDGVLYFGAHDGKVYALGLADRKPRWTFATGDEINSTATIDDAGVLYIGGTDRKVYALDARSGAKKWERAVGGPVLGRPSLWKDLVFVGTGEGDGSVLALKAQDGSTFWQFKTGDRVEADVVIDNDLLLVASTDKNLYAFKLNRATP